MFEWLNENSRKFLSSGYLVEYMTPEQRIWEISVHAQKLLDMPGFADKFYDYMGKGYYSLASPVWSNFGLERGLPVSCFGSVPDDSMESILDTLTEVGMMTKYGGGCSGYIGKLRPRGAIIKDNGESSGSVNFLQLFQTLSDVVSQGSTRRGHFSPYLEMEHKDIEEFLGIGLEGNPIQFMNHGVVVSDEFIERVKNRDKEAMTLWAKVIQTRSEIGYPYILFKGNADKGLPKVYKDLKKEIVASNMCSEIMLPSTTEESFVCVLSSMNLEKYDEWKDTDAVNTLIYFLDSVVKDFLSTENKNPHMKRAYAFARNHRALGLGVLGWHSYLQSKMIPFESREAAKLNLEIFSNINKKAQEATKHLAELLGSPPMLEDYGVRNATLMAVAPTMSSAFILGQVSQSIEPELSNCYVKDLAKLKVTIKNKYLEKILQDKGLDNKEVWDSIKQADGSVQHLSILNDTEKAVFKTFAEISPEAIIDQAGTRTPYIDQGQSLNLYIDPETPTKEINALYLRAHAQGVKSLYYQFSLNAAQSLARKRLQSSTCQACEG